MQVPALTGPINLVQGLTSWFFDGTTQEMFVETLVRLQTSQRSEMKAAVKVVKSG